MKVIQVELPDELAEELREVVQAGWFHSEDEVVRVALLEFVRHNRFELLDQFQREDIAWALQYMRQKTVHRAQHKRVPAVNRRTAHRLASKRIFEPDVDEAQTVASLAEQQRQFLAANKQRRN